jgi:hypothetical protein
MWNFPDTAADSTHTIRPQQHAAIVPSLALRSSSQGGPVAGVQTPRVRAPGAWLRQSGIGCMSIAALFASPLYASRIGARALAPVFWSYRSFVRGTPS